MNTNALFVCLFVGARAWSNIVHVLNEKDGGDTELLVYAMTLINKVKKLQLKIFCIDFVEFLSHYSFPP